MANERHTSYLRVQPVNHSTLCTRHRFVPDGWTGVAVRSAPCIRTARERGRNPPPNHPPPTAHNPRPRDEHCALSIIKRRRVDRPTMECRISGRAAQASPLSVAAAFCAWAGVRGEESRRKALRSTPPRLRAGGRGLFATNLRIERPYLNTMHNRSTSVDASSHQQNLHSR